MTDSLSMTAAFQKLRAANVARQKEWPGNEQADAEFRALEVADEAGEVMGAVKKYARARRGIHGSKLSLDDVADEVGDTIIALDLLAAELGFDLDHPLPRGGAGMSEMQMALMLDSVAGDLSGAMVDYLSLSKQSPSDRAPYVHTVQECMRRVVFWVTMLAEVMGINLWQAVVAKFNKTSAKYDLHTTMVEMTAPAAG